MHSFLTAVGKLRVWHKENFASKAVVFQDDAEIMFIVISAIFENGKIAHNEHGEEETLRMFCEQTGR